MSDSRPDGGQPLGEDIFTRTSDVPEPSLGDRLRRFVDSVFLAPMRVAWEDIRMQIGMTVIAGLVLMGTVGPLVVETPTVLEAPPYTPWFQNMAVPLGTDKLGMALHKQLIHATPAMLKMIFAGAFISVILGTVIGCMAGYKGGTVDRALMAITDTILTIPGLALILVVTAIYRPQSSIVVGLILGIDNWPGLARSIRSEVLSIREESYTEASRVMGLSQWHIFRKDIASSLMPFISINFANSSRGIIFESVGLYFIGILPYTNSNWGIMLNEAYQTGDATEHIYWILVPLLTIVLASLGFILFAQGLDRVFNVRLRARYEKTSEDAESGPVPGE